MKHGVCDTSDIQVTLPKIRISDFVIKNLIWAGIISLTKINTSMPTVDGADQAHNETILILAEIIKHGWN